MYLFRLFAATYFLKRYVSCLLSCCFVLHVYAHPKTMGNERYPIDTLNQQIDQELAQQTPEQQLDFLLSSIKKLQYKAPKKAIAYAEKGIKLAKEKDETLCEAQSRFWKAYIGLEEVVYANELELLQAHAEIAADIFKNQEATTWLIRTYELLATILYFQNKRNKENTTNKENEAKNYIQQALDLYEKKVTNNAVDSSVYALILCTQAALNYAPSSVGIALKKWEKAEQIFIQIKDTIGIARVNLNKGLFAKDGKNNQYFQQTINHYKAYQAHYPLKRAYLRYGTFCIKKYYNTKVDEWWHQGIHYLHQAKDLLGAENICDALNRLGHAHATYAQIDSAAYYFQEAIYRSKKEKNAHCLAAYMDLKMEICELKGNCTAYNQDMSTAYISILNDRNKVVKESVEEKESYIQKLRDEAAKQGRNLMMAIAAIVVMFLCFIFYLVYQRQHVRNLKSENEAQEARIQALGARMNPHFISNTLNAIDSMIYTDKKAAASNYLVQFAKLSRLVLANSESTLIPLDKEIKMLNYYITLEAMRFEEKLHFEFEVDESLDTESIHLPPMLIQPFIENAVLHGIQPKASKGTVNIHFKNKTAEQWQCCINDDGIGRLASKALQAQSSIKRKSYSMAISQDRIQLINTIKGASLVVEDLYDKEGNACGTNIIINLPKKLQPNGKN